MTCQCAPPTLHAFDIDIYDCPCGHMYGDHDYMTVNGEIVALNCNRCDAAPPEGAKP